MAHVAYQVDGVPTDGRAQAWFPQPTLTPAGQFSLRRFIHGFPGTWQIPSPRPRLDSVAAHQAGDGYQNGSDVAPNWFAPQIWWNDIAELPVGPSHAGSGISYMPHPVAMTVEPMVPQGALGRQGPSPVAMRGRKVGGKRGMRWPRLVPRWPNLKGEY